MTQRQVRHQSPPQHGCQLTKLWTCSTLQPVDSSAGWRVPCAGASVGPNLLKTALLVSAFSLDDLKSLLCNNNPTS